MHYPVTVGFARNTTRFFTLRLHASRITGRHMCHLCLFWEMHIAGIPTSLHIWNSEEENGAGAEVIPITALSFRELHDICGHDITGRQIQLILVSVSQIVWYFLVRDGFSHFIHFGGHTRCIVLYLHCVEFSVSEKSVCSWKELQQSLTKGLWNLFYSFSVQITAPGCFIINKQTIV